MIGTGARADSSITVTLTPAGEDLATYLHLTVPEMIQSAEDKFNALFQTENLPSLLNAFAATTAVANRGVGVSYAVKPNEAMVGVTANGFIASDASLGSSDHVIGGFVFNFGLTGGVNLGRFGSSDRWTVFANAFYEQAGYKDLEGHLTTGGAHVQYKAVKPIGHWSGLDITSGLEVARWTISTKQDSLTVNFTVQDGSNPMQNAHLAFNSSGVMNVVANAYTIPIEVTTGLRAGPFNLYGGVGADITSATATIDVNLTGDIVYRDDQTKEGSAIVTATGESSPSVLSVHALAGIQLDLPYSNLYIQGLITPDDEGLAFGVRASF
ncbi:MAG: hypothetical protein QM831_03380 [Kofleriaceae bacterium]